MGNHSTKESRGGNGGGRRSSLAPGPDSGAGSSNGERAPSSWRSHRVSRGDLGSLLGFGTGGTSSSHDHRQHERRESKQEREARRLEKERVARIKERERSMGEEHVDGGYLVTLGTYNGPEDYNKPIVRQLQIERRMAPFWRGLNDLGEQWTEPQIIAAARGLPIPGPGETPPPELVPRPLSPSAGAAAASQNINSPSVCEQGTSGTPARASSPFKPRGKTLAAVLGGSCRNGSSFEVVAREIKLTDEAFVNGQPLEVFLYRKAIECPICFLTYPPYLNHTRCCDQPICSECFVQIKRPDPHFPEGHNENDPNSNLEEAAGLLVSEPACCPYCTQPDFGVAYEPPPFRRGLAYKAAGPVSFQAAAAPSPSLGSAVSAPSPLPLTSVARRRTELLSVNAPRVVTTDRIRPEWATKLEAARSHMARRAAAATALHTAAFLVGNDEGGSRAFRVSRFGRRGAGGPGLPFNTPAGQPETTGASTTGNAAATRANSGADAWAAPGPSSNRRSRMEDLEDMMLMEAIRLSLAAEEERKRKSEKEEKKEAKRREKEERKAAKQASKSGEPYEGGSSASGSSLSLPGLAFGRKRGNSAASNLRLERTVASAMASDDWGGKGKGVDRGVPVTAEGAIEAWGDSANTWPAPRPMPTAPRAPAGPSHLRQMSSASSFASSAADSRAGSYVKPASLGRVQSGSRSPPSEEGGDSDRDRDPSTSTEPIFNFRSLAEVVGVTLDGDKAGQTWTTEAAEDRAKPRGTTSMARDGTKQSDQVQVVHSEHASGRAGTGDAPEPSGAAMIEPACLAGTSPVALSGFSSAHATPLTPPLVSMRPETPAPGAGPATDSKQLHCGTTVELIHQATL